MATRHVIVELNQSRIQVSLMRGNSVQRSASASIQLRNDSWAEDLAQISGALKSLIADVKAEGAEATVLYSSPTAVNGVFSCARAAGAAQAENAARLALAESCEFPLDANPHSLVLFARDNPKAEGPAPQNHTLGIAESEQSAQALFSLVQSAGLTPVVFASLEAPAIAAAAACVLENSSDGPACALFVGEHSSVFAGASKGRLKFLRQIGIGGESLVTALTREVRGAEGSAPVMITADQARTLLLSVGIPGREQAFDASRGLQGDAVLPLLQPVLQRWLVEIKQSLRFGIEESERPSTRLFGLGSGASIPRLHEIVAEQSGMTLAGRSAEAERSATGAWTVHGVKGLTVLPRAVEGRKENLKLTRGLWVGVAAAGLLVAADATFTRMELTRARNETKALDARLQAALPGQQMRDRLLTIRAGLASAEGRMRVRMTPTVAWDAMLAALSLETPARVRLNDVRLGMEAGQPFCRITGETSLSQSAEVLKTYADSLASLPIVSSYRMGATQRGESSAGPVQQFEMTLGLVDFPAGAGAKPKLANVPEVEDQP